MRKWWVYMHTRCRDVVCCRAHLITMEIHQRSLVPDPNIIQPVGKMTSNANQTRPYLPHPSLLLPHPLLLHEHIPSQPAHTPGQRVRKGCATRKQHRTLVSMRWRDMRSHISGARYAGVVVRRITSSSIAISAGLSYT